MSVYFIGMHMDLRMRKGLQSTTSSPEFISIPTNKKFTKSFTYIHDNKSQERCYLLLNNIFTCLRVLCLEDINPEEMEKVYYYLRMIKKCIEKKYLILIIRDCSQTYCHQPIYRTSWMTKVIKKSLYQIIVLRIQKIFVSSY